METLQYSNFILIGFTVLIGSALTLFSGFGLGTLLMPVMSLFFPIELAIFLTAIVHLFNNLFKLMLFYKQIDWQTVMRFGPMAMVGAWLGSSILLSVSKSDFDIIVPFTKSTTNLVNIMVGWLLMCFALIEWTAENKRPSFKPKWMPIGGLISGFFGGLSGHQGALRSAFLVKSTLSKEAIIASGIIIATCIDLTRIGKYSEKINAHVLQMNGVIILFTIACSTVGVVVGKRLLGSITLPLLQKIIAISLLTFSICLMIGWI